MAKPKPFASEADLCAAFIADPPSHARPLPGAAHTEELKAVTRMARSRSTGEPSARGNALGKLLRKLNESLLYVVSYVGLQL